MAKLSEKYETMVVYSLKNGDGEVASLNSKFTSMLEANAENVGVNEWGKRRLAYAINYETEGYYVLYTYDSKPDYPKEFERILNITEGVMRFLTTLRNDAPPKAAPSESGEAAETAESAETSKTEETPAPSEQEAGE